jgi:membrane protease YdiL (CAAX protease family)
MEMSESAARRRIFHTEGVKLRALPIIVTVLLGLGIPILSALLVEVIEHFVHLPDRPNMPWQNLYYHHTIQLLLSLAAILFLKPFLRGDHGLHMPRGKSYVGAAIAWGVFFGLLMTVVDYAPQILSHKPPADQPYPLTPLNIAGWLSFEGIFVGPSEEVLFRGLLVTYLMTAIPGRVFFRKYDVSAGGIIVALIFALAHFGSFFTRSLPMALGQMVYAFVLGVFYAYWFEKSKSLLAPIIGHNVSDVVEYILIFAMVAAWS